MARKKKSNGKGFALGALIGGAVAGMTALLLAPKSGEKMRKDLAKKCNKASNKAVVFVDDVFDHSSKLYKKAKGMTGSAKSAASKMLKRERR